MAKKAPDEKQGTWASFAKLIKQHRPELIKKATDGNPSSTMWTQKPEEIPLYLGQEQAGGQWTGRKKPKAELVTTNKLIAPKKRKRELEKEPMLYMSAKPTPVFAPSLFDNFEYVSKAGTEMTASQIGEEIKHVAWLMEEAAKTNNVGAVTKLRNDLDTLRSTFKDAVRVDNVIDNFLVKKSDNWVFADNGEVVFKALPGASRPPANPVYKQSKAIGQSIHPQTGKKDYQYAGDKQGGGTKKPPAKAAPEDPMMAAMEVARKLGVLPQKLMQWASQLSQDKFVAKVKSKFGTKLAKNGIPYVDLAMIYDDLQQNALAPTK